MSNAQKVEGKEFSGAIRTLAIAAIKADDKSQEVKEVFYAALLKEGILPSSIAMYKKDAAAISRSTFPKKVQEGVMSALIRKDDLIKGVKSGRDQVLLKKVAWQNQINKKADRLLEGYTLYIARVHHKVEKEGTLQPIALDANNRPVKLPKAEKAPEIAYLEAAYRTQVHFSNIKTPRTVEVEIAKLSTKMCDLLKGLTLETKKRFNELSTGKKTVEVTAKTKAKK
jgi:hypothetical protein